LPDIAVNRKDADPISKLKHLINNTESRVLISADSAGRRETIRQLFEENQLKTHSSDSLAEFIASDVPLSITHSAIHDGFVASHAKVIVITESELFAASARTRRKGKDKEASNVDTLVKDLSELKVGDPVVHAEHGIGRLSRFDFVRCWQWRRRVFAFVVCARCHLCMYRWLNYN